MPPKSRNRMLSMSSGSRPRYYAGANAAYGENGSQHFGMIDGRREHQNSLVACDDEILNRRQNGSNILLAHRESRDDITRDIERPSDPVTFCGGYSHAGVGKQRTKMRASQVSFVDQKGYWVITGDGESNLVSREEVS